MSGERIFATTGNSRPTACSGAVITSEAAAGTPRAENTRQALCSLSRRAAPSCACAAATRAASGAGVSAGARQSRQAWIASAHASGVRKAAMPASLSSLSEVSACGAQNTASGFAFGVASTIGSIATCGWNCEELPTAASTRSQWSEASRAFSTGA